MVTEIITQQKEALVWSCEGYQEAYALKGALVSNCELIGNGIWKGHLNAVTDEGKTIDVPNYEFHEGQAYFYQVSNTSKVQDLISQSVGDVEQRFTSEFIGVGDCVVVASRFMNEEKIDGELYGEVCSVKNAGEANQYSVAVKLQGRKVFFVNAYRNQIRKPTERELVDNIFLHYQNWLNGVETSSDKKNPLINFFRKLVKYWR